VVPHAGVLAGDVGLYARVVEAQLPTDVVVVQVAALIGVVATTALLRDRPSKTSLA